MPSIRDEAPITPGDRGVAEAITGKLGALEKGVLTDLPQSEMDLLRHILVTNRAILIALCARLDASPDGPEDYLNAAHDLMNIA